MDSNNTADSILTPEKETKERKGEDEMMGSSPTSNGSEIGVEEDLDEEELYNQALKEQAKALGIDPEKEAYLMHIAETALLSPPPVGWSEEHLPDGRAFLRMWMGTPRGSTHPWTNLRHRSLRKEASA